MPKKRLQEFLDVLAEKTRLISEGAEDIPITREDLAELFEFIARYWDQDLP